MFINDVGQNTWEEIDEGQIGADYGWNVREGHCANGSTSNCGAPPAGMTNPIYDYGRGTGCSAITGAAFVPFGIWPAPYDGAYLFADYGCGKIFRLVPGSGGSYSAVEFLTNAGGAVAMTFGPYNSTQALYYAVSGQIRRVFYSASANRPPTAVIAANPSSGPAPLTVSFSSAGSSDPDGDPLTFAWTQIEGPVVTINGASTSVASFTAPAVDETTIFTFRLTVSDGRGGTSTDTVAVTVEAPEIPMITISSPIGGESWQKKTKKQIRWFPDAGVTGPARIELSRDGGATYEVIIASVDVQKGKKKWTVKGPTTTTAKIRVVLISDARVQGTTPGLFTIRK
jgi:PKD repeat protein